MKGPHNPHDKLFKSVFSRLNIALDYIVHFLPEKIVSKLQLDTLKQENTSYLDQKLKPYYSDIVYSCHYGSKNTLINITLLFEHKSNVPPYPHLQILRYMLECWDQQVNQKIPLTPIIPIIIYHGQQKWPLKPFQNYFEDIDEILDQFFPAFDCYLTDLSQYSDEDILALKMGLIINIFLLFKHHFDKDFIRKHFNIFFTGLDQKEKLSDPNFIKAILVYFVKISDFSEPEVKKVMDQIPESVKEAFMNTYDMIIEKGIQKGDRLGAQKTKIQVIEIGLKEGLSVEMMAKLTQLSEEEVRQIISHIEKTS